MNGARAAGALVLAYSEGTNTTWVWAGRAAPLRRIRKRMSCPSGWSAQEATEVVVVFRCAGMLFPVAGSIVALFEPIVCVHHRIAE